MDKTKIARGIVIVVCLYLIVTTLKSMVDLYRAGDKLTRREKEITRLKDENEKLTKEFQNSQTTYYLEKVARNELAMSREGEKLVVIPKQLLIRPQEALQEAKVPYWMQWRKVFFGL